MSTEEGQVLKCCSYVEKSKVILFIQKELLLLPRRHGDSVYGFCG